LEPDYPVLWATTHVDPMNPEGWEDYLRPVPWGQTVWVDLHE